MNEYATLSRRTPRRFWGWGNTNATLDSREQATIKGMLGLLGARIEDRPEPQVGEFDLPAPRIQPPSALAAQFSATPFDRLNHSAGKSYADCARMWLRQASTPPDWVAFPDNEQAIIDILDWAQTHNVAVIPYGGGSSVCGGVEAAVGDGFAGTISLDLFAVLLGGVIALLPIYAQEVLEVGPTGLGLLRSAMAIGEVSVGLYLSMKPFNRNVGLVMFGAVALFGVANLVFALSSLFWLSFAALVVAGGADMVSMYIRSSLVQFSTPDAMRGRVNAVNMLFIGSSNELGEFRAGTSAAWFGVVPAALIGCACTLTVTGGWMLGFKSLRKVNRFEDASPAKVG